MRIRENNNGTLNIVSDAGDLVRTTEGGIYLTSDYDQAREALAFLAQRGVRTGSHRMKSLFGRF